METFLKTFPRRHDSGPTGPTWKRFGNVSTSVRSSLTGLEDPKAKVFGEWGPKTFPRRHDQKKTFPRQAVFADFSPQAKPMEKTFPRRPVFTGALRT